MKQHMIQMQCFYI